MVASKAGQNIATQDVQNIWTALAPYLSADMADLMFSSSKFHLRLHGKKQIVSVLFADIKGFSLLAELMDPEECVEILNAYLAIGVDAVLEFGGMVDKFQGDCLMAVFADDGCNDHERRAVNCAFAIREAVRHLEIPQLLSGRVQIGIGINTGVAMVGCVGSDKRMDYTAIGDVVNVAHRFQTLSLPDQIIISESTWRGVGEEVEAECLGDLQLKDPNALVHAYSVKSPSKTCV